MENLTLLGLAVENNKTEIVSKLLEKDGIDVNKANDFGDTPLLLAVQNGEVEDGKRRYRCK